VDQFRGAYNQGLLTDPMDMASFDPYAPLAAGLMFAPGSGFADVAGYAPSMTTAGEYEPSMMANIGSGQYLDAGLQGLGLLGDAFMAAGAFVPPLIPVGAAMKAPRAARVAGRMGDYEYGARTAEVGNQGLLVDPGFQNLSRDTPDISGSVVRDLGTLAESPVVDFQKLIGRTALLVPGDMTMAGREITHVKGIKLKNPVRMRGGKDFPAEELSRELGIVWASDIPIISRYVNAAKRNPGLVGVYSAMGGRGGDFSHHVADVLVDMTKQAEWLSKDQIESFNNAPSQKEKRQPIRRTR
jgi:hypothetical protein